MKVNIKKGDVLSPENSFFIKILDFDNKFGHLIQKARNDAKITPPLELRNLDKNQFYKIQKWVGVILNSYNLPQNWSWSIFQFIITDNLSDPKLGIEWNILRDFVPDNTSPFPLIITIYEHLSIKEIKDWLDKNKEELNFQLSTLPHKRRVMDNEELVLEILTLYYKKKMRISKIYKYYEELNQEGKLKPSTLADMLTYSYISNIIDRFKKALKAQPYNSPHKKM